MKTRARQVLRYLCDTFDREQTVTLSELAGQFGVSVRTMRYDIQEMNDFLRENRIPEIRFGKKGILEADAGLSKARALITGEDGSAGSQGQHLRDRRPVCASGSDPSGKNRHIDGRGPGWRPETFGKPDKKVLQTVREVQA